MSVKNEEPLILCEVRHIENFQAERMFLPVIEAKWVGGEGGMHDAIGFVPGNEAALGKKGAESGAVLPLERPVVMNGNQPAMITKMEPACEHPGGEQEIVCAGEHMHGDPVRRLAPIVPFPFFDLGKSSIVVVGGGPSALEIAPNLSGRNHR